MAPPGAPLAGFLERVREVNNLGEGRETLLRGFRRLTVDGAALGLVSPALAPLLLEDRHGGVFREDGPGGLTLDPALAGPEARTAAVDRVLRALRAEGALEGWREERYPVLGSFGEPPAFLLERAAAAAFGIKAYGVHVNGYVRGADGRERLWVARRSAAKPTWPGMLDHLVAGGQPHGVSPMENVVKECQEEASIPEALARTARPVGAVAYETLGPRGVGRDVLFCFDLELPESFVPVPQDGEVDEFMLLDVSDAAALVRDTRQFKPNCNLVVIDFLVRHGHISPEEPGYLDLLRALRGGDCR